MEVEIATKDISTFVLIFFFLTVSIDTVRNAVFACLIDTTRVIWYNCSRKDNRRGVP